MIVELRYGVTFGKCDSTDWIEWEIELTEEEEIAYEKAISDGISPNKVDELKDALRRAYKEIEDEEISNGLDMEDEYVMECQGEAEMDSLELNELVANRDPHALAFFGLEDADDDEIDDWDADDLDELPLIKDFIENFEPYSPYDEGWDLHVEFYDPEIDYDDYEIEEEE